MNQVISVTVTLSLILIIFNNGVTGSPYTYTKQSVPSYNNHGHVDQQGSNVYPQGGAPAGGYGQPNPQQFQGGYNAAPQAGYYGQQQQPQQPGYPTGGQPQQQPNQYGGGQNHGNHQGGYKTHGY